VKRDKFFIATYIFTVKTLRNCLVIRRVIFLGYIFRVNVEREKEIK